MPVQGRLGEDEIAVEGHLEAAFPGALQLDGVDHMRPPGEEFIRQTDGLGDVVSGDAELDVQMVLVRHRRERIAASTTIWAIGTAPTPRRARPSPPPGRGCSGCR